MTTIQDSPAIKVARAHIEAWSRHDFAKARKSLADNVKVHVTTTQPIMVDTNTVGADAYMTGLEIFARRSSRPQETCTTRWSS
jgi:hypothetical protein